MAAQGLCHCGVEHRGGVGEFSMQWRQGDGILLANQKK